MKISVMTFPFHNLFAADDKNIADFLQKIKAAGFSAFITTQKGEPVTTTPAKKSNEEIAREVIQGKWGNGADRKKRLTDAGYDYDTIQTLVNKLVK